jgi:hypothetical protein
MVEISLEMSWRIVISSAKVALVFLDEIAYDLE